MPAAADGNGRATVRDDQWPDSRAVCVPIRMIETVEFEWCTELLVQFAVGSAVDAVVVVATVDTPAWVECHAESMDRFGTWVAKRSRMVRHVDRHSHN